MVRLSKREFEAAMPFLELFPDPVLWIDSDFSVLWRNRIAEREYGSGSAKCFTLTHGRGEPCSEEGETCPVREAEGLGEPVRMLHAHTSRHGELTMYRVLAIPVEGGGVLEVQNRLDAGVVRDELTGLYRREFWMEIVRRDQALLGRLDRPYAVLFLDLDHFKDFNDRYGHLAGDELLRAMGECLRRQIRTSDAAGRYGGEEFVLFLPNTSRPQALQFAERLRGELRRVRTLVGGGLRRITTSIGVHGAGPRESLQDALEKADAALYRAKARGRDQVCSSEPAAGGAEATAEP